jgi:hypothetical protein
LGSIESERSAARCGLVSAPLLSVNASLTLPDGKVIWTGRGHVTNMSASQDALYHADALENPELARKALEKAATIVAKELVSTLEEAP